MSRHRAPAGQPAGTPSQPAADPFLADGDQVHLAELADAPRGSLADPDARWLLGVVTRYRRLVPGLLSAYYDAGRMQGVFETRPRWRQLVGTLLLGLVTGAMVVAAVWTYVEAR